MTVSVSTGIIVPFVGVIICHFTVMTVSTPVCHCQLYPCHFHWVLFSLCNGVFVSQWDSDRKLGAQDLSLDASPVYVCHDGTVRFCVRRGAGLLVLTGVWAARYWPPSLLVECLLLSPHCGAGASDKASPCRGLQRASASLHGPYLRPWDLSF